MAVSTNLNYNETQKGDPQTSQEVTTSSKSTKEQLSEIRANVEDTVEQTQESISKSFAVVSAYILGIVALAGVALAFLNKVKSILDLLKRKSGTSDAVYPADIENYFNQYHPEEDLSEMTPEQVESQIRLDSRTYNDYDFQKSTEQSIEGLVKNSGLVTNFVDIDALCKTLLLKYKSRIPSNNLLPTEDQIKRKAAKGISYDLWRSLLIKYQSRPYCYKRQGQLYIGVNHKVENKSEYITKYPEREEYASYMVNYFNMFNTHSFEKWEQYQVPAIMPLQDQMDLLIQDIKKYETLINQNIKTIILSQHQFDGLVWWLFNIDPSKLNKTIKSINTLACLGDDVVVEYIQNWYPIAQMTTETQNKNSIFENIYCFATYPIIDGNLYVQLFEYGYMKYCYMRDNEPTYLDYNLTFFETYNESLAHSQTKENLTRLGPLTDVVYPVPNPQNKNIGVNDTGINTDNTICYGWFGSPRAYKTKLHFGVDLVAPPGNSLYAPYSGKIWRITEATNADIDSTNSERLKRIVILPDKNKQVLVSLYYTYPHWTISGIEIPNDPAHFRYYDVEKIEITNGGTGYQVGDVVSFLDYYSAIVTQTNSSSLTDGIVTELEILVNYHTLDFDNKPDGRHVETFGGHGSGLTLDVTPRANYEVFEGDTIEAGEIIGTVGNNSVLNTFRVNNFIHVQFDWREKEWSGSAIDGIKLNSTCVWSTSILPILLFVEEENDLLSGGFVEDENQTIIESDGVQYPARVFA